MIQSQSNHLLRKNVEFSLPKGQTVHRILNFLSSTLPIFLQKFMNSGSEAYLEDEISTFLVYELQDRSKKEDLLFHFDPKKGADFCIQVSPYQIGALPIFTFETKRLPPTNNKDYVYGDTGGIERFKSEKEGYASHLSVSAMIGYVQRNSFDHWVQRINNWVDEMIVGNPDAGWCEDDKLIPENITAQYISTHSRPSGTPITLYHFWLLMN